MKIEVQTEQWAFSSPFAITGHIFTAANIIVVTASQDGIVGRGEAGGVYYHDETPAFMSGQINALAKSLPANFNRDMLQTLLPPGGARNALDCALWDLEAKLSGLPVWQLAELPQPRPLRTTMTLGVDTPDVMAQGARNFEAAVSLKLKLSGDGNDAARVLAVRAARPDVWIGVDANQGLDPQKLAALMPTLMVANVSLIEQPFKLGHDADLDGVYSPILLAADESVQSSKDIPALVGRYDVVNIKLDKCGGLTEAIKMVAKARELRLRTMVGCMEGTGLSTAPGWLVAQICDYADLDASLPLREERQPAVSYANGYVSCPDALWGNP